MIVRLCCAALSIGVATGGAQAEAPPDRREIIVTGERVDRSIQDTASSVALFGANDIAERAADSVDQLLAATPNLQPGSGSEGPAIRGQDSTGVLRDVSAFLGGTRPRVTLQVDGRAVSYYEYVFGTASTWDIERVEVFRSPQATTQGRNSIGGAIFVRSKDPAWSWEGTARGIVGNYGLRQGSAVVSGPIVAEEVAFRVSGDIRRIRTSSDMADGVVGADLDHDDYGVARARLLVTPKALPDFRLEATYVHGESKAPQFEAIAAPFQERRFPTPERTNGVFRIRTDSWTALAQYRFTPALTGRSTLSWGDARFRRFALPQLGEARVKASDFSAETTLDWNPEGPVRAFGGVYRLTARQRQSIDVQGLRLGIGTFGDRQVSLGLFGEATWRALPRLAVTGGLRYQRDRQDREGLLNRPVLPIPLDYDETFDAWLPKLSIAYDLAGDATAGLLVQRAFNPGGTTISQFTQTEDQFGAEALWSYEAFLRAKFAGGRGLLVANLFYNDLSQAQRLRRFRFTAPNGTPVTGTDIVNVPSAESYGAEVELSWRASDRLSLRLGAGLLKTKVLRTLPADIDFLGKEFQRSPHVSASAAVDWRPVAGLQLSVQARGSSGYFSDDANNPLLRIAGSATVNARAAYTQGGVTVFGYVRNLLDSYDLTYLFEPIMTTMPTIATAGDPREVGLGLEFRF